jgi:hypothetical protein
LKILSCAPCVATCLTYALDFGKIEQKAFQIIKDTKKDVERNVKDDLLIALEESMIVETIPEGVRYAGRIRLVPEMEMWACRKSDVKGQFPYKSLSPYSPLDLKLEGK